MSIDKKNITILVVDDEEMILKMIQMHIQQLGYNVITANSFDSTLNAIKTHSIDIALLDYSLPDGNGIELMKKLKEIFPNLQTMIMTGYGTIEKAVEALKAGAWDFITKPITTSMFAQKLERINEVYMLYREHDYRQKARQGDFKFSGIIGNSEVMSPVYEAILRAGASNLPCLIEGETGSGKEYIAESIHLNSARHKKPFIILDCTATPTSLFEATLFGSTKGAFTGAVERKGLLEAANGGTLFLDEVGEISAEIQPKLLRCLETKRFRPVGGTKEIESDFRIICATNRNILEETHKGNFRTDLFYRISAQRIHLPPLRERQFDIQFIAKHFLDKVAADHDRGEMKFSPKALQALCNYQWPGNIRQLKFVIESAFFNTQGDVIELDHLSLEPIDSNAPQEEPQPNHSTIIDTNNDFKSFRENAIIEAEHTYLDALLNETEGDVRKAAEKAGLTREALYRVMSRCNITPADYRN